MNLDDNGVSSDLTAGHHPKGAIKAEKAVNLDEALFKLTWDLGLLLYSAILLPARCSVSREWSG